MKNLKDTLTTVAGILIALAGTVLTCTKLGVVVPEWLITDSTVAGVIGASIVAYLTGKNPDGSTKSAEQVAKQNEQAK